MTIAVNGPVHFDDYVSVINSRIGECCNGFRYGELQYPCRMNVQIRILRPSIILAPIELELPNHGWAHIPLKGTGKGCRN